MNNNLSLIKIISGLSRTLKIANQVIPLYKQAKPLITKSSEIINNVIPKNKPNQSTKNTNILINSEESNNSPTFFQ